MEYMRPEMVDHDGEERRRQPGEQARETGDDVSAHPGAADSQLPPPPPQHGSADGAELEALRDDNPRGRTNQADTVDQQRAWQNADEGAEQTYSGSDPV